MTAAPAVSDDRDKVLDWRREELERAGYGIADAYLLADHADVDLHKAAWLLANGCSVNRALDILL